MAAHDPTTLFQLAAGLIPALALGGALAERLAPPSGWRATRFRRFASTSVLVLGALFVIMAEAAAVRGALGDYSRTGTWLVAFALYLPLVATVLVVV